MRKSLQPMTLLFAVCLISACAMEPSKAELKNTGEADMHAVSDQMLRTVMQNMKSQTVDREEPSFASEAERQQFFNDAIEVADSVQSSGEFIAAIGERLKLGSQEHRRFSDLASQLVAQAGDVRTYAEAGQAGATQRKMNQMIGTCNSCHDRFRTMPAE